MQSRWKDVWNFYALNNVKCNEDFLSSWPMQKQPSRAVLEKRCSENMQQIYKTSIKLQSNFILRHWLFPANLLHIFILFPKNTSGGLLLPMLFFHRITLSQLDNDVMEICPKRAFNVFTVHRFIGFQAHDNSN